MGPIFEQGICDGRSIDREGPRAEFSGDGAKIDGPGKRADECRRFTGSVEQVVYDATSPAYGIRVPTRICAL